ncbi:MAG: RdgB/HAM1 family non-canonical purine NTP pyrophosphatase [Spirochaetes bacterium]|nr:RdgB/HAM1 family non-canonical purine NTP pyrophosphatase [Spirochaetota bacterium]
MNKLIIASRNRGKISEISSILEIDDVELVDLDMIGFSKEIQETGSSFEENAIFKARTLFHRYRMPVITDDSGLCVDYLRGTPGIYSARFAGPGATDDENNALLIEMLEGVPPGLRTASFVCWACFFFDTDGFVTTKGEIRGVITYGPEGDNGFGYDPIFYLPAFKKTMAQIDTAEKNSVSHRAQSFRALKPHILEYFTR